MFDTAGLLVSFFGAIGLIIFFGSRRREPCKHLHTRCIHGDEINWRAKQYVFRFWKPDVLRRQLCTDCGKALDRVAICTATGEDRHVWEGPWPNHFIMGEFDGTG